jgi:hypothetical protein
MSLRERSDAPPPATSLEVRSRLVEALKLALVGPGAGHPLAEERLHRRERPSNWYLTGFLIPSGTPRGEASTVAHAGRSAPVVPAAVPGPGGPMRRRRLS